MLQPAKTEELTMHSSPELQWAVLSFHGNDKLRFMSNSDNKETLSEGINRILEASGQTQRGPEDYWKAKQWKLRGDPFFGIYGMDLRLMVHHLTKILKLFHSEGWKLGASADVSAKMYPGNQREQAYPLDTHSWFFLYDPDSHAGEGTRQEALTDQFAVEEIRSQARHCL